MAGPSRAFGREARPVNHNNDIDAAQSRRVRLMSLDVRGAPATGQVAAGEQDSPLRVAVIDNDSGFLQVLSKRFGAAGWEYRVLSSAVSPERLVSMRLHALIVDLSLLGGESWDYLHRVCARLPGLGVIVCTGPSSLAQRVRGLRLGADAWITKPCHPEELLALVWAVVRRHRRGEVPTLEQAIEVGGITIRPDLHQAYAGRVSLELTAREFEILQLLSQAERVLRREEIYERLWGYAMAHGDRSVDVFVGKLRQKLRTGSPEWTYIHTHFGIGYRFEAKREPEAAEIAAPERGAPKAADPAAHEAAQAGPASEAEPARAPVRA
jgi:DNA-binding response OmpR family regulator